MVPAALSFMLQVGSTGISSLSKLTTLQDLDLSYTEVSTLQPILESCPHLQSLSIASCRSLGQDALLPLLDPSQPALSHLRSLDASYCDVQDSLVAQLLLKCRKLKHLALSGCAGVTDAIWEQVESVQLQQLRQQGGCGWVCGAAAAAAAAAVAAGGAALMDLDDGSQASAAAAGLFSQALSQTDSSSSSSSQLESLSLVRCSNLRSLCLGLLPASGQVELLPSKHYLLSADRSAAQAPAAPGSWVEVPSSVSELTSLKVGLSGLQVVALALPKLSHLDLSSCKHLRMLELRCPLLLQLQLQACRALPVVSAVKGVLGSPYLQMLDVQHMGAPSASSSEGQGAGRADSDSTVAGSSSPEKMQEDGAGGPSSSACVTARGSSLLAAVAVAGVLPPAVGCSAEVQIGKLLDEVAATHGTLKAGGILRCTNVCKVCSKLAQCSL
jgi:Leucine-rich repeat (LRR) protein